MTVCRVEEQKKQGCRDLKHFSPVANEVRKMKLDCTNELGKVEKAIEANNLCYNCETGFHYMKQ